jgi:hypothetical protein
MAEVTNLSQFPQEPRQIRRFFEKLREITGFGQVVLTRSNGKTKRMSLKKETEMKSLMTASAALGATLAVTLACSLTFPIIARANMPVEPISPDQPSYCNSYEEGCIRDNDRNGRQDNEDNVDSENDDGFSRENDYYNEGDFGDMYH